MVKIHLPRRVWRYDPDQPLGPEGGFGAVYAGESADGQVVAVKRLKVSPSAGGHRELRIADELADRRLGHVVPILDSGQDESSGALFVVMARAERSLQSVLDGRGTFPEGEAVGVLLDILSGLDEVSDIVHRDLKPGNVLLHEGVWKVADFGIARFVEETTSAHTLKGFLSPHYGAPEQWREEHASAATDLYALGCIAYSLITGRPPFSAPDREGMKDAHLHAAPPSLPNVPPTLASLCTMLLAKQPTARPGRDRVRKVLQQAYGPVGPQASGGLARLAQAGAAAAHGAAATEAESEQTRARAAARAALAAEGMRIWDGLIGELFQRICDAAPAATRPQNGVLQLEGASLRLDLRRSHADIREGEFPSWGWDVVAWVSLRVVQEAPRYEWGASFLYASPPDEREYRWYEVSFCASPLVPNHPNFEPFALPPCDDADIALSRRMTHTVVVAYGPHPVDLEDFAAFVDRWADLFTKAVERQLRRPGTLPLE